MHDLDHAILVGAKNTDSWRARKGDFQCAFPLHVTIVPSSMLAVVSGSERLMSGGFSLGETIRLGSFNFITD
jgi:hypothetical protein